MTNRSSFVFQAFLMMTFLLFAVAVRAQSAGSLDTTFGTNGRTTTNLTVTATLYDLKVQPDGKTIASGITFGNAPNGNVIPGTTGFVARFNQSGTLDTTFNVKGYNNSNFMSQSNSVVVQSDGKIIVGGTGISPQGLAVARFNPDGSLDTTFNGIGTNVITVGTNSIGTGVSVQADGKIVIAGAGFVNGSQDFAMVRFNVDGTLDTTFGSNGRQATNISGNDYAYRSTIQPDGKIILTGYSTDPLSNLKSSTIVRYNSNGTLDTTFGAGGIVNNIGTQDITAYNVFFQPNGKIIATGSFYYNNSLRGIVRYNQNGTLDTAFELTGVGANDLRVRLDGKILTAGGASSNGQNGFGLARYNADGTLDLTFGTNGTTFSEFFSNTYVAKAIFTPDGKVVAGGTQSGGNFQIVLARYFSDSSTGRVAMDFDGDGKSDLSVFRPSTGYWYTSLNPAVNYGALQFGQSGDKLVPADYDGDGKSDVAVYRSGTWYLQRSTQGFTGILFGDSNDIPVPADYDGDGKAELAVFRPSNGYWYLLNITTGQFTATQFGQNGDKPVAADYDGDGKTDIAVNRNGNWYIQRSQLGFTGILFGDSNDKLVPADYDGDGKADIAVFRPSNGTWYLQQSTAGFTGLAFGLGTDLPVAADYDGDGKADIAVVRNGNWYLNRTTQGFTGIQFGTSTDLPIPNSFVR